MTTIFSSSNELIYTCPQLIFIIDGGIRSETRQESPDKPDSYLDPDAIAQTYLNIWRQPRSAWTWEIKLRPWVETF